MRTMTSFVRSILLVAALLPLTTANFAAAQYRQPGQSALLPLPETLMEDLAPLARAQLVRARQQLQAAAPPGGEPKIAELAAAFGLMGKTALAHGLYPLAEASLENARTLQPETTLWAYLAGVLYESQERWEEAAAAYENVLAVTSDDALAQFRLGRVLARAAKSSQTANTTAKADRARRLLEGGLKNSATASAARFELALLDDRPTPQPPTAFPDPRLEEVLALQRSIASPQRGASGAHPASNDPHETIRALLGNGESAQAVSAAQQAVQSAPANANARLLLGLALTIDGQREAALAQYRELLSRDSDHRSQGLAHLRIARLLEPATPNEAPPGEAVTHYRKAVELTPLFANARLGLADALMRSNQFDEAIEHLAAMTETAPDDSAGYAALAKALARAGRYRQAHAALRQGFERLPSHPLITFLYGRSLAISPELGLRDGSKALSILLPLFKKQPSLAYAEIIAAALATAGKLEEATRWQSRVVAQAEKEGAKPPYLNRQRSFLALYQAGKPRP